jgi:hypothetical protein
MAHREGNLNLHRTVQESSILGNKKGVTLCSSD